MLTKSPTEILQIFTSEITAIFRPIDISHKTGIDYKHTYTTLKSLAAKKLLIT